MSSETRQPFHPSPIRTFLEHDAGRVHHTHERAIKILVEEQHLRDQLRIKYSNPLDPKALPKKLELLAQELKITTVRPFHSLTREQRLAAIISYLATHKIPVETLPQF